MFFVLLSVICFVRCLTSVMVEASKSANQFALFLCRVVTDLPLLRELRFIFSRTIVDLGRPGLHDYLTRRFIAQ